MEFQITNKAWVSVSKVISDGILTVQPTDARWQVLGKGAINLGARGIGCMAALVALVATPFFLCADVFLSCVKSLRGIVGKQETLIDFYRGTAANIDGIKLQDIWNWDDQKLEDVHSYIQWIFPTVVASSVNPTAPTLTPQTIADFKKDPAILNNLRRSFSRMLQFYGLQQNGFSTKIDRAPNFAARTQVWLTPSNHNFLRISRILSCLRTLGLATEATAFHTIVHNIAQNEGKTIVSPQTLNHWK